MSIQVSTRRDVTANRYYLLCYQVCLLMFIEFCLFFTYIFYIKVADAKEISYDLKIPFPMKKKALKNDIGTLQ